MACTVLLLWACLAWGTDFYASPSGVNSGSCPQNNPCNLNRCMGMGGGGNRCILLNGTYPGQWQTQAGGASAENRFTIMAQNRHQAILRWNAGNVNDQGLDVRHSNLYIRNIQINCAGPSGYSWDCLRLLGANNVIVEDMWVRNSGHALIFIGNGSNIDVRHNTFEESGLNDDSGEGLYLASSGGGNPTSNVRFYRNLVRRFTNNAIDCKNDCRTTHVHRNIFEDQKRNAISGADGDGNIRAQGNNNNSHGNVYEENIMRRGVGNYTIRDSGNRFDVINSAFLSMGGGNFVNPNSGMMSPNTIVSGNVGRSIPTGNCNIRGTNNCNASQAQYDARFNAIMGNPSPTSCEIGTRGNDKLTVIWQSRDLPISKAFNNEFAVTYDGTPQTETATIPLGFSQTETTLASPVANGTVDVDLSLSFGAAENSLFIGGLVADNNTTDQDGQGVNGVSAAATLQCTNNFDGDPGDPDPPPPPPPPPGDPTTPPYAVNLGGGQYTGVNGIVWADDRAWTADGFGFIGGDVGSTANAVEGTLDDPLYQTYRFGAFQYNFNIPVNGLYTVDVLMAVTNSVARSFTMMAEGVAVANITDYDVFTDVGINTAIIKRFTVNVTDGTLDLETVPITGPPRIGAIHVFQTTTGEPITEGVSPSDDAYICEVPGTCGDGEHIAMVVRHANPSPGNPGNEFRPILRFDLAHLPFVTVTSAILRLHAIGVTGPVTVRVNNAADDNWNEFGVTWDTAPALGSEIASQVISNVGTYEWNITSAAVAAISGDKNLTLYLHDSAASGNSIVFDSKDSGFIVPRLIITGEAPAGG